MRRKHVPQRTCIVCRQPRAKRELVRLVRTPEGALVVDETGRRNGRGAYLCRERTCWEAALRGTQIAKALKIEVGDLERQMLREYMDSL
ncbi:MAG: YlxR family protein [Anaerolineae bacterium]|nr:YlxR family protein [Anaerolineae bacterium]